MKNREKRTKILFFIKRCWKCRNKNTATLRRHNTTTL